VFLVLGAIVSVAVAWVCAYFIDVHSVLDNDERHRVGATSLAPGTAPWGVEMYQHAGAVRVYSLILDTYIGQYPMERVESFLPSWAACLRPTDAQAYPTTAIDARGWPLIAMYSIKPGSEWNWEPAEYGLDLSPLRSQRLPSEYWYRCLPLRPIWPGFAINTVFHAVVLWLLFAGPFVLRRRRRIRRGLYPKCAYDLRGTAEGAACPECGAAVTVAR